MPTVKAKFVESGAGAIANMTVRLWHFGNSGPYPTGDGKTDSSGAIAIDVSLMALADPIVQLRAENAAGRELWRSDFERAFAAHAVVPQYREYSTIASELVP